MVEICMGFYSMVEHDLEQVNCRRFRCHDYAHVLLDFPHDLMIDFLIFVGCMNSADFLGC